jgi:hypothetical protein
MLYIPCILPLNETKDGMSFVWSMEKELDYCLERLKLDGLLSISFLSLPWNTEMY